MATAVPVTVIVYPPEHISIGSVFTGPRDGEPVMILSNDDCKEPYKIVLTRAVAERFREAIDEFLRETT